MTNGFLPLMAFERMDPTAIATIDLAAPLKLDFPDEAATPAGSVDTVALVRWAREPLGVVHIAGPHNEVNAETLASNIWNQLSAKVIATARSRGNLAPSSAEDLVGGLGGDPQEARVPDDSVAVIVPTGGRVDQLMRATASIQALNHPSLEILIVDNRPGTGGTREAVENAATTDPRIRYIAEPRPGSSVARNRGISETSAEFVAFTDDDVVVDDEWLDWLIAPFTDPAVNAVTGMVLPLQLATAAQKQFELYAGFSKGVVRREYDLKNRRADQRLLYPYWGGVFGSGNSMAFRRSELAAAGGFDPALGAGSLALAGADIEAFSAAILRGGTLVYEPRSICWHEHRRDDAALAKQVFNYGVGFTAILTKAATHDWRFPGSVARSVPVAFALKRRSNEPVATQTPALPEAVAKLQSKGMLRGPGLYVKSLRWSKRLGLQAVIEGEPPADANLS